MSEQNAPASSPEAAAGISARGKLQAGGRTSLEGPSAQEAIAAPGPAVYLALISSPGARPAQQQSRARATVPVGGSRSAAGTCGSWRSLAFHARGTRAAVRGAAVRSTGTGPPRRGAPPERSLTPPQLSRGQLRGARAVTRTTTRPGALEQRAPGGGAAGRGGGSGRGRKVGEEAGPAAGTGRASAGRAARAAVNGRLGRQGRGPRSRGVSGTGGAGGGWSRRAPSGGS